MPIHSWGVLFVLLVFLLIFVSAFSVLALGIYELGWSGPWMKYVPLPAAMVNGKFVTQHAVFVRLAAYEKSVNGGVELAKEKKLILARLTEEKIISDLAGKQGIVVTETELARHYDFLVNQFGIRHTDAENEISQRLGLSEKQFKKILVRPDLLETKLKISFMAAATEESEYKQARFARQRLVAGLDFTEAARLYSDDEKSKFLGGQIGFFKPEELEPRLADAISNLRDGDISDIVISPTGYNILQIAARTGSGDDEQVLLRKIFIQGPDFEEYLEKEKQNYKVYVFWKL